jgi:hypothetical protein
LSYSAIPVPEIGDRVGSIMVFVSVADMGIL